MNDFKVNMKNIIIKGIIMFPKFSITIFLLILLLSVGLAPVLGDAADFQEDNQTDQSAITIEGPVQAININIITIADIEIHLESDDPLLTTIQIGTVVMVQADVDDSSGVAVIQAETVVVTNANIVTPVITVTGPVQTVNVNIVTIFNIDIQFNPDDPILLELNVGDVIQVSGNIAGFGGVVVIVPVQVVIIINVPGPESTPEATPETTPDPTPDDGSLPVTIVIEGPVQAINVNIITIFDIDIQVDPNDPILVDIEIGDIIRIEGTSISAGDTIIIVAVNIIIITIEVDTDGDTGSGPVVQPPSAGFSKDACKKGGWQNLSRADGSGFRNQGDCIQYANTGK